MLLHTHYRDLRSYRYTLYGEVSAGAAAEMKRPEVADFFAHGVKGESALRRCRYTLYGDVSAGAAAEMKRPEVADFFARLIQRVSPKSYPQAVAEVTVTRRFLENFSGGPGDPKL